MYKATLTSLTMLTALVCFAGAAHAQAPDIIVDPNCDAGKIEKITRAVDGAMKRLADVDNVINSSPAQFNEAFAKAFGKYEPGSDAEQWAGIGFILYHANIRPLLTHTAGVTISSGPAPTWPRVTFRCAAQDYADLAAERIDDKIVLYPVFFEDKEVPNEGRWGKVRGSRIGTILHESIHLLGGPADIREDGRLQDVQAEELAKNADGRALSNAANYEMFYMSYPFQSL